MSKDKLNFYTVDLNYVNYLQQTEMSNRGFSRVPNMNYGNSRKPKFLCGIVLQVNNKDYYVPVSSYKQQKPDNFLIRANNGQVLSSLRFLLPLFIEKPMMYPRGEKFQYNNSGYVFLAMIIEKIAGVPFDQYLQTNVFDVCGMTSTGYYELDRLPAKCANNYIFCEDTKDYRTNIFSVDVKGTGAGGAFISVRDIVKFWKGLKENKLLPEELVSKMLRKQSGDGSDAEEGYYGYGVWIIEQESGMDIPYFQGYDPGVSFISEYNPENNTISVLVSNYGDNVWSEMRKIRENYA